MNTQTTTPDDLAKAFLKTLITKCNLFDKYGVARDDYRTMAMIKAQYKRLHVTGGLTEKETAMIIGQVLEEKKALTNQSVNAARKLFEDGELFIQKRQRRRQA